MKHLFVVVFVAFFHPFVQAQDIPTVASNSIRVSYMGSVTKGMAAICLAKLHTEGKIDFDQKVATCWPGFAQNGKEDITVSQLLSHQSGLCLWDGKLAVDQLSQRDLILEKLETATPFNNDQCFGFGGASGSMAFADPINRIGYCYVPNSQGYDFPDGRDMGLQRVLYECLLEMNRKID